MGLASTDLLSSKEHRSRHDNIDGLSLRNPSSLSNAIDGYRRLNPSFLGRCHRIGSVSSMAGRISMGARREVVSAVTERYPSANRTEKGRILNAPCSRGWRGRVRPG